MDVAVLVGGRSPEHEVSMASGRQVFQHLDRSRWRVWPVWLDREGGWWPAADPLPDGSDWVPGPRSSGPGPLRPGAALDFLVDHAGVRVVFPVLHGPNGEDGTVQGMLELYELACVGSGCAASAVAMDKIRTRQCLLAAGVPMPRAWVPQTLLAQADAESEARAIRSTVGFPCFLKVDCSGSTLGVARCEGPEGLAAFLDENRSMGRRFLAEELVEGEEITVPVLGNAGREPRALPVIGIYPERDGFFTHSAKYEPGRCLELIPPRGLDPEGIALAQHLAVRCHEALGCDGMSRTDMIVGPDGPVVLEVNTIPGLTGTSLLPQAAAADGMDFSALLDHLLELALHRCGLAVV